MGNFGDGRGVQNADPTDPPIDPELLREVPRGALTLAGVTVALLLAAWFAIYLFVFLPRGVVG